jgi:hypothetical protein
METLKLFQQRQKPITGTDSRCARAATGHAAAAPSSVMNSRRFTA